MHVRKLTVAVAAAALCILFGCKNSGTSTPAPQPKATAQAPALPQDVQPTCTVTSTQFAGWFQSGKVTLNGVVNPANSIAFQPNNNCDFYQWSKQMFLWLTSPAPPEYGGGAHVFDSPVFYDVTAPDANNQRHFVPHVPGTIETFNLRSAQVGAHGLPVVFDRAGTMLEVAPATAKLAAAAPMVRDASGKLVAIAHAQLGPDGQPVLLDKAGKPIATEPTKIDHPMLGKMAKGANPVPQVHEISVDGVNLFLDAQNDFVPMGQGQADNSVLEAQNGSLVYYATMANDVYAYFTTMKKDAKVSPDVTVFPTTQAELTQIVQFAAQHGKVFPDPNALAVEIKTAWVEASSLPNPNGYVTMQAVIPTYNTSNPQQWTPGPPKQALMALVGVHVVGSVTGHPEMVWATFEHVNNAPLAPYTYINTQGQTVTVPQNTSGAWLFTANGSTGPFNYAHMQMGAKPNTQNIVAKPPYSISPSDTIRWKAWGAASDLVPNQEDKSVAASNTEILSINNSVDGMMPAGDIRTNYNLEGATWTFGGASPVPQFNNPRPDNTGNQIGTSQLANVTMETYQQGSNTQAAGGSNCFSCHGNSTLTPKATARISHIYKGLQPLF
jgi:hypothetical protein